MTITLDQDYFAVASEPFIGYCGETNSRVIDFVGLDNTDAQVYSLVLSYDDGECYETRIKDNAVTLTNNIMRKAGIVEAQVYACNIQDDEYTVVRKSNILQLVIKRSVDENARPVPTEADCLRLLDQLQRCADELAKLCELLMQEQETLDNKQLQLMQDIRKYIEQTMINKSAIGLQKRNLLRIGTQGYSDSEVTMTVGENGELTLNGETFNYYKSIPLCSDNAHDMKKHIPNGSYILCSNGFSKLAVSVTGYKIEDGQISERSLAWCQNGQDIAFTVDDEFDYNYVELYLDINTSFENELVLPMIRYAQIGDNTWEPYKPSLQEQIDELRSYIVGRGAYNETRIDHIIDDLQEIGGAQ